MILIRVLYFSFSMFWEVLWPLFLGFLLSAIIQSLVPQNALKKSLGGNSLKSISLATFFGAISSSCSYAAVALSKSLYKKGAGFANAMIFEIASTNLVIELGIVLYILMGWQFALAEILGGIIMIVLFSIIVRFTFSQNLEKSIKKQIEKGLTGRMENHAEMDMSITGGSIISRIFSKKGFTTISYYFVMDWAMVYKDILLGFIFAGALSAWVPDSFWRVFFISNDPKLAFIWGPLIGPIVSVISFVCSVGNIPLAAVLWQGGISFGGVISFIFADLIVLPILNIYRKYYGLKAMFYILFSFYITMAGAGYITELIFGTLGIIPTKRNIITPISGIEFNYTTVLNIIFIIVSIVLIMRFNQTGGRNMLVEMDS
ncbi:MAG TPA: permease [Candidatus Saccharimonadales bacterium]|nr:permease [Candidatus Saccharimonadales bacterium]